MKIPVTLIAVLACSLTYAQHSDESVFPMDNGIITYTKIVQVDSVSKNDVFVKIKDWAAKTYGSQKVTLDAEDKEGGLLTYKGYLPTQLKYAGGILKGKLFEVRIYHSFRFYIKDGKFKYVFTDLKAESHAVGDEMINHGIYTDRDQVPLEKFLNDKVSAKKREWQSESKKSIDDQIKQFLASVEQYISHGKSEFNF